MKKYILAFFLFLFIFTSVRSYAQQSILLQNATGNLIMLQQYVDVQGSPFYNTEWITGNMTLVNNKVYKNVNMKYDQLKDKVYVKANNGDMILLGDKVKEFTLDYPVMGNVSEKKFRLGYYNIPDATADSYFEVLADGKTQLLKRVTKFIQENQEYNSASATKTFMEVVKYYVVTQGNGTLIKKDKKSILKALSDKQPALEKHISDNNLNFKQDTDIAKLVTYYNTL